MPWNESALKKTTGDTYLDSYMKILGKEFSDKEIDMLCNILKTRGVDTGLQRFFESLFALYHVKSNEKLVKSNRFHSWAMVGLTAGLLIVAAVALITKLFLI